MQKSSLYIAGVLLVVFIGMHSCKKSTSNNQIVATPYSFLFSDTAGAVYNSTDGKTYSNIFPPDGFPCRAISSQSNNIILVKNNLYVSTNNGGSFSSGFDSVTAYTTTDCNNFTVGLNQSMILDVPSWDRVYITTNSSSSQNFLGLAYSSSGELGTWNNYELYDTFPGAVGHLPVNAISFTRLTNGVVACLAIQSPIASPNIYRNFYKTNSAQTYFWEECTGGVHGAPRNDTGVALPGSGFFTLGHLNNQLIAIDSKCTNGAYYSNDTGRTWIKYSGIPANTSLLSISSPFEEICLIGSSSGLYILNQNTGTFQLNTNGLASNTRVFGITYKQTVYTTGATQKYVYLATNKGIYQSVDGGNNWQLTIPGNYTAIY